MKVEIAKQIILNNYKGETFSLDILWEGTNNDLHILILRDGQSGTPLSSFIIGYIDVFSKNGYNISNVS